jgi:Cdc6-like AAA superfamily ATPase
VDEFRLRVQQPALSRRDVAHTVFHPSQPIRHPDMLFGREAQLDRTITSLDTPGRSVFIYGERGVGKTSLAQTAAYMVNSSDSDPVFLSCSPEVTFSKLAIQVARRLAAIPVQKTRKRSTTMEANVTVGVLNLLHRIETSDGDLPTDLDTNDAVDLFIEIAKRNPDRKTVVVLDEIDTIASETVRRDLAYLLKQLGDRECPVKFIYVGIADTVEELLRNHESASRYIAAVQQQRLSMDTLSLMVM